MKLSLLLGGLLAATVYGQQPKPLTWAFCNELTTGPVTAQFKANNQTAFEPLNTPRISPRPNITSFEWWYFDAVNPNNVNESAVVILYLATPSSFLLRGNKNVSVSADVFLSFADGAAISTTIDSAPSRTSHDWAATLITKDRVNLSGNWTSAGVSFDSLDSGKEILVNVHSPQNHGLVGSIDFKSVSRSRYPCTIAQSPQDDKTKDGVSLEAVSHVGWANTMPDADVDVSFVYNNKTMSFKGIGYQDQMWGDRPFHKSVKDWYWGHARLGPYSLVWLHSTNHDKKTFSSAYISHPNQASRIKCENDLIPGSPKPSVIGLKIRDYGYDLTLRLPRLETLTIKVQHGKLIGDSGRFMRWTGKVSTIAANGVKLNGTAIFQEFHY